MTTLSATLGDMPRKQMPRDEKKVNVAARVTPSVLETLNKAAQAREWTLSYFVSKVLTEWAERDSHPRKLEKR